MQFYSYTQKRQTTIAAMFCLIIGNGLTSVFLKEKKNYLPSNPHLSYAMSGPVSECPLALAT